MISATPLTPMCTKLPPANFRDTEGRGCPTHFYILPSLVGHNRQAHALCCSPESRRTHATPRPSRPYRHAVRGLLFGATPPQPGDCRLDSASDCPPRLYCVQPGSRGALPCLWYVTVTEATLPLTPKSARSFPNLFHHLIPRAAAGLACPRPAGHRVHHAF